MSAPATILAHGRPTSGRRALSTARWLCRAAGLVLSLALAQGAPASAQGGAADATATAGLAPMAGKTLRLGAGDVVRIVVFQNNDLALETRLDGAGRITYPFLGAIDALNKTTAELEALIAKGLEERNVLRRAEVSVSLLQFRSQQVAVLGNVNRPGNYPLDMAYTAAGALAVAGGLAPMAGDTVVLSRVVAGKVSNSELDLVQMFRPDTDRRGDVALEPGDILFVHRAPVFYVHGEVQRPGAQRLERDMTVRQAIAAAGGLNVRGTMKNVRISRKTAGGVVQVVEVEADMPLRPDDVVLIRESLF